MNKLSVIFGKSIKPRNLPLPIRRSLLMLGMSENYVEIKLPCLRNPFDHGLDEVIDVRTPKEYSEDHIPDAINLPVLTDEERHEVGKEYADNSFMARRIGASLISSNISKIINSHFMDKPKSYSCLIYCWRGGQRSRSIALVLSMIGYNVKYLSGGYKTYRKEVMSRLSTIPSNFSYNVVGGMTGCGKTLLLQQLREAGQQILDLEALANHKGSVLGINNGDTIQPTTKMFESLLLHALSNFDPDLPVWVEAEGRVIGGIHILKCVFELIKSKVNSFYVLESPLQARVKYLLSEYKYWTLNPAELKESLERLSKLNAPVKKWYRLIDESKFEEFVEDILITHYDPSYKKSQGKSFVNGVNATNKKIVELKEINSEFMASILPKLLPCSQLSPTKCIEDIV